MVFMGYLLLLWAAECASALRKSLARIRSSRRAYYSIPIDTSVLQRIFCAVLSLKTHFCTHASIPCCFYFCSRPETTVSHVGGCCSDKFNDHTLKAYFKAFRH
jgi:hypothetical protein